MTFIIFFAEVIQLSCIHIHSNTVAPPAGPRVVSFASSPAGQSSYVCYHEETLVAVLPGKPTLLS